MIGIPEEARLKERKEDQDREDAKEKRLDAKEKRKEKRFNDERRKEAQSAIKIQVAILEQLKKKTFFSSF